MLRNKYRDLELPFRNQVRWDEGGSRSDITEIGMRFGLSTSYLFHSHELEAHFFFEQSLPLLQQEWNSKATDRQRTKNIMFGSSLSQERVRLPVWAESDGCDRDVQDLQPHGQLWPPWGVRLTPTAQGRVSINMSAPVSTSRFSPFGPTSLPNTQCVECVRVCACCRTQYLPALVSFVFSKWTKFALYWSVTWRMGDVFGLYLNDCLVFQSAEAPGWFPAGTSSCDSAFLSVCSDVKKTNVANRKCFHTNGSAEAIVQIGEDDELFIQ